MSDDGAHGTNPTDTTAGDALLDQLRREPSLVLRGVERKVVVAGWERSNGNVVRFCKILGIGRTTGYRKLRQYGLIT